MSKIRENYEFQDHHGKLTHLYQRFENCNGLASKYDDSNTEKD